MQVAFAGDEHMKCSFQVSFRPADPEGPGWAILAFATPEIAKAVGSLNSIGSLCPGMSSRRENRVLEPLFAGPLVQCCGSKSQCMLGRKHITCKHATGNL